MKIALLQIAHARSGDKGDASNVGLIAYTTKGYQLIKNQVTTQRVKEHFKEICKGSVERFEVENLKALNFLLHNSLGGGGSESVKTDAQGKTHGQALLQLEIDLPDDVRLSELLP